MGCDDLHHKRKARDVRSFKRKRAKRAPYDMVLIVCEGEKTEPNYFWALVDDLQLNTANVVIAKILPDHRHKIIIAGNHDFPFLDNYLMAKKLIIPFVN
jgi:hypothetical protein